MPNTLEMIDYEKNIITIILTYTEIMITKCDYSLVFPSCLHVLVQNSEHFNKIKILNNKQQANVKKQQ